MQSGQYGEGKQSIAAEPDIGLLSHRDEAGIAGKQIPEAGQRDIDVDFSKQAQVVAPAPERRSGEHNERGGKQRDANPARGRSMLDAKGWSHYLIVGNSPSGRTARTRRKARCPASSCQPGLICAPIACDTPRIMPPASVPHMLPRPPMMTASNPKIRRAGPMAGSKLVRTAMSTPAMATTASEMAIASANTCRLSRPMSCATAGS